VRSLLSTTLHSHLLLYEVRHSYILTLKSICRSGCDENIPNNQTPFHANQENHAEDVTQTREQVSIGQIIRSRAKKLHHQVTSFLAETNFNIYENFILPKCATLVVLRYTDEEKKQDRTTKNRPPDRTTKRNSHNF
jgi:hypothetical protein